ncbi:FecR domain-containing protein [Chitinophaga ginsengisoli]|uniref:FecR family protein n=1 Tax=Chitinophaga ginsengisoli TaxID=363837 RepID=A0A2P8GI07_9BACT|nr:FecR domain-containing protein [Chitinophaga ginsengisoli]PSL33560.1 FecR family protein [Chitinophaga ginsengisoli]
MNNEQITQLVIDELAGDITPEDAALLQQILRDNPAAVILRDNVIKLLTEGDMEGVREEEVSIERSLTQLKKYKRKKTIRSLGSPGATILVFLLTTLGAFLYKYSQQVKESKKTMVLEAAMYKYPVLLFEDGSFIRLDTINGNSIPNLSFDQQHSILSINGPINHFAEARFITPRGATYQLILPDASSIYTDGKTAVSLFLDPAVSSRKIAISGQAFVAISPDPTRPFTVDLPQKSSIRVLGTSFNINTAEQGSIQAALKTGKIRIENESGSTTLEPDSVASWQKGTNISKAKFDPEKVFSWRQGTYICTEATLRGLARVMERCFPYRISVDVPEAQDQIPAVTREMARGNDIIHFLNAGPLYRSDNKFTCYFDKDSILHISLNHVP